MRSRKTLSVLVLLALVAMVAIFYLPWAGADRNVPPGPFAMTSAAATVPYSPIGAANAMTTAAGAVPPFPRLVEPDAPSGRAINWRVAGSRPTGVSIYDVKDLKEGMQVIAYVVDNTTVPTAMKILGIAAPDAQFTASEDNKKLTVVATPDDHERIRALLTELRGYVVPALPRAAQATLDTDPRSAGWRHRGDGYATTLPGPGTPSLAKSAKTPMRTAEFNTSNLKNIPFLVQVLEAVAPKAGFTVGGDGKSLTVSAPPDELERVTNTLKNLLARPQSPRYADPIGQPWRYSGPPSKREPDDPEMAQMEQSDAIAGKKVAEIVKECKTATGEEQQAEVRWKLKKAVLEHFAVRQAKRELEVSRLEARLEKVRQSIAKRSELEDQIVDRHISELLGEADDLAF